MNRYILAVLMALLPVFVTADGAPPIFSLDQASIDQGSTDLLANPAAESKHASRALVKRHEFAMVCGHNAQPRKDGELEGPEDIALSRRCLGTPYRYNCNSRTCSQSGEPFGSAAS